MQHPKGPYICPLCKVNFDEESLLVFVGYDEGNMEVWHCSNCGFNKKVPKTAEVR